MSLKKIELNFNNYSIQQIDKQNAMTIYKNKIHVFWRTLS